jgi:hypothetical protein
MNKGTIYWDESSRGYHHNDGRTPYKRGRWVGEKFINGRRVRMRSTDYDKVAAWMGDQPKNDPDVVPLVGLTGYSVNIREEYVIGKYGQRLNSKNGYYWLRADGNRLTVNICRLMYASLHHIDVRDIPSDIVVVKDEADGHYRLHNSREIPNLFPKKKRDASQLVLCKIVHEAQMLKHFYDTGRSIEVVRYAMSQTDSVSRYLLRNGYVKSQQRASDIASQAVEQYCDAITSGREVRITTITPNIRARCRRIVKDNRNTFEYR